MQEENQRTWRKNIQKQVWTGKQTNNIQRRGWELNLGSVVQAVVHSTKEVLFMHMFNTVKKINQANKHSTIKDMNISAGTW